MCIILHSGFPYRASSTSQLAELPVDPVVANVSARNSKTKGIVPEYLSIYGGLRTYEDLLSPDICNMPIFPEGNTSAEKIVPKIGLCANTKTNFLQHTFSKE